MTTPEQEFDRQLQVLLDLDYPDLTGQSIAAFTAALDALRPATAQAPAQQSEDHVPFVLVVARTSAGAPIDAHAAMGRTALGTHGGFADLDADDLARFRPVDTVTIPDGVGYLLRGVDTGSDYLNVTPADALTSLTARGRSGLTVEEGIALLTARPDMLRKNKCFSLLASRCGDKRVPALWISQRRPKLGWCWNGNPHTWLGSASTAGRIGT
ncbi:DUF5701 family protein [Rhodococcus sp. NPDC003318]|uniref:DUF5701 family protein n=1 Tax=Rhodococcus sp. NPDC003318 TaxID=3364503 RepID=UPI00367FF559